jgi:hypothetical protein
MCKLLVNTLERWYRLAFSLVERGVDNTAVGEVNLGLFDV